jgi:hypothetical protein
MSNGVRYTPTFAMPSEYEQQAMEARRRRRMAEMLAAQAYQPQDVGVAPIPSAAPLVQGLQSFLLARQLKKAEEAEGKARTADVESAIREMQRINAPTQGVEFDQMTGMRPEDQERIKGVTGQTEVMAPEFNISDTGEVTGFQPMQMGGVPDLQFALPQMSPEQKRVAYAQMLGGGPVSQLMGTQGLSALEKERGESPYSKINVLDADPDSIAAFERTGRSDYTVLRKRDDPTKPLLTPKELADLRVRVAEANVNRAKILQDVQQDFRSTVPGIPSIDQLLAPSPYSGSAGLETGDFTPRRGLQYQGQARTATGEPTSAPQKPVIERVSPKKYGEMVEKAPIDKSSTSSALGQISMMRNLINDLKNHGGIDYIFGSIQSTLPNMRGAATSAQSIYTTLRNQISTETLKQSRSEGFAPGSITENEWPRFETAIGPIQAAKDPRAMLLALQNADNQLAAMEQRVKNKYEENYGSRFPLEWSAPTYKPESSLYPRPEAAAEDKAVFDRADQILMKMRQRGR